MKIKFISLTPVIIIALAFLSCSPQARYDRMLKRELAKGVRSDSLFMGLYLGMPQKDFYTRCWALNKKGLIRQGMSNTSVEYKMKDELKHPATMNFYPNFTDGKIVEMPVIFKYDGWAPWNKELSTDNLEKDVLKYYEKLFGGGFISVRHRQFGTAYVKIQGNRRISIFKREEPFVWAVFTDLSVKLDATVAQPKDLIKLDSTVMKREIK
jgi:hypothetical protein